MRCFSIIFKIGSNILSIEIDVNIRLEKEWNVINKLLIMKNSDLYDEIKRDYFQAVAVSNYGMDAPGRR